jgi:hypothetical protein
MQTTAKPKTEITDFILVVIQITQASKHNCIYRKNALHIFLSGFVKYSLLSLTIRAGPNVNLNYQPIGSGGVKQFAANKYRFWCLRHSTEGRCRCLVRRAISL